MKELISVAVLVATLYGGTRVASEIYKCVRREALTAAAAGLPRLSPFDSALTRDPARRAGSRDRNVKPKEAQP